MRFSSKFITAVLTYINYYSGIGLLLVMVFGAGATLGENFSPAIDEYFPIAMIVCAITKIIAACLIKLSG